MIVLDVVVVTLGADEDVGQSVPNVIAKAGAEIFHEVIAAGEVHASGGAAGGKDVEAVAGNADTGDNVEAKFPGQLGLEQHVDVGEDRAIVFGAKVAGLVIPPGGFYIEAEAMGEADVVGAEAEVGPAFFDWRMERHDVAGNGGRNEDAAADQDVTLLS